MKKRFSKSWFRVLSGLFTNLSAGWLGLIVITPNFIPLSIPGNKDVLIYEGVFGILSLVTAIMFDERGQK